MILAPESPPPSLSLSLPLLAERSWQRGTVDRAIDLWAVAVGETAVTAAGVIKRKFRALASPLSPTQKQRGREGEREKDKRGVESVG